MKCLWIGGLALASFALAGSPVEDSLRKDFFEAMQPVNRVVVRQGEWGGEGPNMKVLFDRTDRAAIETLMEYFEPAQVGDHCMCLGDQLVEFFRDEEFVLGFTVHHLFRLRGHSTPWFGDLELTGNSEAALWDGFAEIGYDGFKTQREEWRRNAAEAEVKWAEFVALFPESARGALSRGRTMEERLDRTAGLRLLEALGDSVRSVETLWRAVGWQALETRVVGERYNQEQPMVGLYQALGAVSVETQLEALQRWESPEETNDDLVDLGAAVFLGGGGESG